MVKKMGKDADVLSKKGSKVRPIRLPIGLDDELQRVAEDQGTTISDVIRRIVTNRIDIQSMVAEVVALRQEIADVVGLIVAAREEYVSEISQVKQRITRARLISQEMARMQLPAAKFEQAMKSVEEAIKASQENKKAN
jgi:hypothetical protein